MALMYRRLVTPVGELLVASTGKGLCRISFLKELSGKWFPWFQQHFGRLPSSGDSPFIQSAERQLDEYFRTRRHDFELELDLQGSAFQQRVWKEIQQIEYGQTVSYRDIAVHIATAESARAVGQAVGHNPLPIVIPCHRVVGSAGGLVGFGGGLGFKEWLLELEGARIPFAAGDRRSRE